MNNDILFHVKNNLGVITLNRPHTLNALNDHLFDALKTKLHEWEDDENIKAVLIRSSCEKAFCAGGDIRSIYENRHHPVDIVHDYFRLEYEINHCIFHFPKPYISLAHGITMGGGVGVSVFGSHRIAAENLRWAMPETLIGFFPDVGATHILSRLPHHIGKYLAITGNSIDAQTALTLKLIHAIVPYSQFDLLEKKLVETHFHYTDHDHIHELVQSLSIKSERGFCFPISNVEKHFAFDTVELILESLQSDSDAWCQEIAKQIMMRSPTSMKVALHQLMLAKNKSFDEVISTDLHIAKNMLYHHDFFEGIRAAIIDKDKNPKWNPQKIENVTREMVLDYFENQNHDALFGK